jgi:hypothetical protein
MKHNRIKREREDKFGELSSKAGHGGFQFHGSIARVWVGSDEEELIGGVSRELSFALLEMGKMSYLIYALRIFFSFPSSYHMFHPYPYQISLSSLVTMQL